VNEVDFMLELLSRALHSASRPGQPSALVTDCANTALAVASAYNGSTSCIGGGQEVVEESLHNLEVLTRLPAGRRFDLLVVTSAWVRTHRSESQLHFHLRRLRRRLRANARAIFFAPSMAGASGLGAMRRMVRMLTEAHPNDDEGTRLHLAFSLLQMLPSAHPLRRNLPLLAASDLTDIDTLYDLGLVPPASPTPPPHALEMLASHFVHALCGVGFAVDRLVDTEGRAIEPALPSRLSSSSSSLHWLWRAQLHELLHADRLEHVALASVVSPQDDSHAHACSASLRAQLASLHSALHGVEPAIISAAAA
jgi:hypothetical protein